MWIDPRPDERAQPPYAASEYGGYPASTSEYGQRDGYLQDSVRKYGEYQQTQAPHQQQATGTGWLGWVENFVFGEEQSSPTFIEGGSSGSRQGPPGSAAAFASEFPPHPGMHMQEQRPYMQGDYYEEQVRRYQMQQEMLRQEQLREQQFRTQQGPPSTGILPMTTGLISNFTPAGVYAENPEIDPRMESTQPRSWQDNIATGLLQTEEQRRMLVREEQLLQEQRNLEQMKQEGLREEQYRQERLRQEQQRQLQMTVDDARQELMGEDQLYREQLEMERTRQDHLRREQLQQERLQHEQLQLDQTMQEDVRQEYVAREGLYQQQAEFERARQEHFRREQMQQERLQQEQLQLNHIRQEDVSLMQLGQECIHQERFQQEQRQLDHMVQDDMRQERLEQEQLYQKQLQIEQTRQEHLRREQLQREHLQQEQVQIDQTIQHDVRQERLTQDHLYRQQLDLERAKQEHLRNEQLQQQKIEDEQLQMERLRQEQMQQEQLRQEQLMKQEQLRQEQLRQEQLRQEQLKQEQLQQEQLQLEQRRQEQMRQDQLQQEQLQLEQRRQEQMRQEQLQQERLQQEQLQLEQRRQEQMRQDQLQQEQLRQEQLKQEQLRQEQIRQEQMQQRLQQEQLRLEEHRQQVDVRKGGEVTSMSFMERIDVDANGKVDITIAEQIHVETQDLSVNGLLPVGTTVQYLSSNQGWVPAVIHSHAEGKLYNLDVRPNSDPRRVRLPVGTKVQYLSSSKGVWLPAVVQAFDEKVYKLDINANADPARVRLHEKQTVQAGSFGIDQTCHVGARKFLNAEIGSGCKGVTISTKPETPRGRLVQGGEIRPAMSVDRAVSPAPIHAERFPTPVISTMPITQVFAAPSAMAPVLQTLSPAPVLRELSPAPVSLSAPGCHQMVYDVEQRQVPRSTVGLSAGFQGEAVTAYLPKVVNGHEIVSAVNENTWRASNVPIGKALGIAYRREKDKMSILGEDYFLGWGLTIQGVDEGDGWVRVQVQMASPNLGKSLRKQEGLGIPLDAKVFQAPSNPASVVMTPGMQPYILSSSMALASA